MWSRWTCWLAAVLLISACSHGTLTRVVRTDGTAIVGELIAARPDAVVIKVADGSTITIPRAVISAIESATTPVAATATAAKGATANAVTKTGKPAGPIAQPSQPGQNGQPAATNAQAGGTSTAAGGATTAPATATNAAGGSGTVARPGPSGSTTSGAPVASAGKTSGTTSTPSTSTKGNGQTGQTGQSGDPNGSAPALAHDAIAPSGTMLELSLNTPIGSDTSAIDDKVDAVLRAPLVINGEEILGAGALAHGIVTEATPSAKADGRGRLSVRFETIQLGGRTMPIQSAPLHWEAPGVSKRPPPEEKKGLFGKIVSKTKKGLRIGDEDGAGARGSAEVRFAPGAAVKIRLEQAARIAP
jgi:hypothetical protein